MNRPVFAIFVVWLLGTALWWGFAFVQLPGPTPEWLLQARGVCFGETISGLPSFRGWMTLIVPPLLLFLSVLFVFSKELTDSLKRLPLIRGGKAFIVVTAFGLTVEAGYIGRIVWDRWPTQSQTVADRPQRLPAGYLQTKISLPDFNLTNQHEEKFSRADFRSRKTILTFAFANCHTVCPMIVKNSIDALNSLDPSLHQLVIITLDPWRDRPGRLQHALTNWDAPANVQFLSGQIPQVVETLKQLRVPFNRDTNTGDVTHPALVYVVNGQGEITFSFNNPSVRWLTDALSRI